MDVDFDPGCFRVVFMGTPLIAVPFLEELVRRKFEVSGVVSRPDRPAGRGYNIAPSPVSDFSRNHQIPVLTPLSLKNADDWTEIRNWSPDVIVVVAYGKILPKGLLELPRFGCINVHASLLPQLRGASPIQWAILKGLRVTGLTVMKMDEGMDTGPVLASLPIPVDARETTPTLTRKMMELGPPFLVKQLSAYLSGDLEPSPQKGQASVAPLIRKEDGRMDFTRPAVEVDRHVRAMTPWPGAFCDSPLGVVKILSGSVYESEMPETGQPGTVVEDSRHRMLVSCGAGFYCVEEIQKPGKRVMTSEEFLRGHRDFPGVVLNATGNHLPNHL
ncbi:MAG: methionyl-tRNA formyltransferase [Leptospirillum sp.]